MFDKLLFDKDKERKDNVDKEKIMFDKLWGYQNDEILLKQGL